MPPWLSLVLEILLFSVIIIVVYNALKIFVLEKININKWIVLAIAIIIFVLPSVFRLNIKDSIWMFVHSSIVIIFILWFMDLVRFGKNGSSKKEKIVIKPKAKPNRVKNIKQNNTKKDSTKKNTKKNKK